MSSTRTNFPRPSTTRIVEQHSQPCLLRGRRAGVDQRQGGAERLEPAGAEVPIGQPQHVVDLEGRRTLECVEPRHRLVTGQVSPEVVGGARHRRHWDACDLGDFVGPEELIANHDSGLRAGAPTDQFDGGGGIDPVRAVKPSRSCTRDDATASGPEPRADRSVP